MIIGTGNTFSTGYDNKVDTPELRTVLALWLEDDLATMQREREELDARIRRTAERLEMLRGLRRDVESPERPESVVEQQTAPMVDKIAATPAGSDAIAISHPTRSIMSLKLETRTHNALTNGGVTSFSQMMTMSRDQLRALPGFGAGCLQDLEAALERVGITLPEPPQMTADNAAASAEVEMSPVESVMDLRYRFGVTCADDIRHALNIDESESEHVLRSDARFVALDSIWIMRQEVESSWIGRRIVEVLSAMKSIAIEPLYQSIKRVAGSKFLEQGCRMPPRSVLIKLVQQLRAHGVLFDIVHEIVSLQTPVAESELSRTNQAILKAFGPRHRALCSAEVVAAFESAGMSEASANLALSTAPLIVRLERGIYGLLGRTADLRDIASARMRREAGKLVETT